MLVVSKLMFSAHVSSSPSSDFIMPNKCVRTMATFVFIVLILLSLLRGIDIARERFFFSCPCKLMVSSDFFFYLLCNEDKVLRYLFNFPLDIFTEFNCLIFTEISSGSLCLFSLLCIWTNTKVTWSRTICRYFVFVECLCLLVEFL